MLGASVLLVTLNDSIPTEVRVRSINWQVTSSSSTIRARFCTSLRSKGDFSHRPPRARRRLGDVGARNFVAVEAHRHAHESAPRRSRLYAHHMPGALPLCRRLARNFTWHLKKYFHRLAVAQRRFAGKINAGC